MYGNSREILMQRNPNKNEDIGLLAHMIFWYVIFYTRRTVQSDLGEIPPVMKMPCAVKDKFPVTKGGLQRKCQL